MVDVLVEQEHPGGNRCIGRSARFAPEVDGLVYIEGHAPLNQIVSVAITAADTYDLFGQVATAKAALAQHAVSVRLLCQFVPRISNDIILFQSGGCQKLA